MFRPLRHLWIPGATIFVLVCCGNAFAQESYRVTDLGTPKNDNYSMVMSVNNQGWTEIMAGNFLPGQGNNLFDIPLNGHAFINVDGLYIDLGTLGGPNSWMNWGEINELGQVVGDSETAVPDPGGEDICGFGTHLTCRPFLWQFFHMYALPTLGGNNGEASAINNHGQIVGMAENGVIDSSCPPGTTNNRIALPVLWRYGEIQALPTVDHDPDGFAYWINDRGQAVGYSGNCSSALHALAWKVSWGHITVSTLPDLGHGGVAYANNNAGQIVGVVGTADGPTGAIWQNGMLTVLPLLPGDAAGIAFGDNDRGQVVGANWDSQFNWSHAFIWQNGVVTDLNKLFPASSNLCATFAAKINDRGQIGGQAIVLSGPDKGQVHAFLATPVSGSMGESVADVAPTCAKSNLPDKVSKRLLRRFGLGRVH